jgi:hypothetical protein
VEESPDIPDRSDSLTDGVDAVIDDLEDISITSIHCQAPMSFLLGLADLLFG